MEETQFIERLKTDKKFYKKICYEKGLLSFLFSNYKNFLQSSGHKIHTMEKLMYYKPGTEGTDEGFGEYGIMAVVLNEKGREELPGVVAQLKEKGLMEDIGNIRYESRGTGYWKVDLSDFQLEDENEGRLRRHSTDNLLIFALIIDSNEEGFDQFDRCLCATDEQGKRWVLPLSKRLAETA